MYQSHAKSCQSVTVNECVYILVYLDFNVLTVICITFLTEESQPAKMFQFY